MPDFEFGAWLLSGVKRPLSRPAPRLSRAVERLRRSLEAFDRRDRAAWLAFRDQDHEVVTSAAWPEADAIHGREAAWKFYIEVTSAFEGHALAPHAELVDAGPNTVLVHHKQTLRGRTSGANVGMDYWVVVTFRDGVMIRDQWFADRAAAFDAARASA